MGKSLIIFGITLAVLGLVLTYAPGLLGWFGKLPGDIRIDGQQGRVFIPITSMLIVSLALSLLWNLLQR